MTTTPTVGLAHGTALPRLSSTPHPAAIVFAVAALAVTTSLFVAVASPIAILAAAPALFVSRTLGDYRGGIRVATAGLAIAAVGGALLVVAPAVSVLAGTLVGIGGGVTAPAAVALVGAPNPRAGGATPTPRITLPRRFEVPNAGRARYRAARLVAIIAGGILAVGLSVSAHWTIHLGAGMLATVLVGIGLHLALTVTPFTLASEASGAILLVFSSVLGTALIAAALAEPASTGMGGWAAAGVAVLSVVVHLAAARRQGSASLSGSGRSYKAAVSAFDATVPLRPSRAATVTNPAEIREAVGRASAEGLSVRAHSTGHAAGVVNSVEGSALLKVLIDEPVTVDAERRTVRIPAGTSWRDVVAAITPYGLGAPHGSSSHVGAVGYLLRGGLSAYGRTVGIAANSIESIELVVASGDLIVADRSNHSELFWALRGGGGGFGVVTAVTVRLFDLYRVVTGTAIWSMEHADDLALFWDSWRRTAPRGITTTLRVLDFPAFPGLPRSIVGKPLLVIDGSAVARSAADVHEAEGLALDMLTGLRQIAAPILDTWKVASPLETANTHMDPPIGPPHTSDHLLLESDGPETISAFLDAARSEETRVSSMELRQLGGALSEAPSDGGAVSYYRGDLALWGLGIHSKALPHDTIVKRLDAVRHELGDWNSGYSVPTFAPDPSRPQRTLDTSDAERAASVRAQYDPDGVFAGDVSVAVRGS
ncbi:FAD/FMN-containing dehydrogenase [Microbacteriaceae bacterium SG_E_30_P1]|uniref:FAD/FMN-containing dehydrogenase n=1 Tax=Antiquaquibacter oligotrophicus TaxID=2880260 RepID=A0ABT6KPC0_9MICO|nr:FAD-binding protein [Antiquaquibacter oligotrophicus]MDH6181615.1 FAD/FMN-containing dehydrogenase [Antiquaquibacter oligotrophicus]UDF12700.1 FAD-binding protein [Antiquaquibacter oligotrophicus]